ncbi:hypothetical protein OROHE_000363 [Orobanche hederae]
MNLWQEKSRRRVRMQNSSRKPDYGESFERERQGFTYLHFRMKKELKRNPTELELFDRTHMTDGEYVCPMFKKVRIWKDAAGRAKGRRLYGFGNTRQTLEYERDGVDVEGSSLDQGALEDKIKLKECTKDLVKDLKTILPEMVCEVLEHLRQNDLEDEETKNSYDSYDSYEDNFEINMNNSRRHHIYAKKDGKKHVYGKSKHVYGKSNGDKHDMYRKHKKTRKQKLLVSLVMDDLGLDHSYFY